MARAYCGFIIYGHRRQRPRWRQRLTVGAVVRHTPPPDPGDAVPPPGTFIIVARRGLFSPDGTQFLPAVQGAWGTAAVRAPVAWGTVKTAERTKEAPVKEEEDVHGKLYKAGLGDERQKLTVKCQMRLGLTLGTGDEFVMLNVTWYVASVTEVWSEGEYAELNVGLVRWPGLTKRGSFEAATL